MTERNLIAYKTAHKYPNSSETAVLSCTISWQICSVNTQAVFSLPAQGWSLGIRVFRLCLKQVMSYSIFFFSRNCIPWVICWNSFYFKLQSCSALFSWNKWDWNFLVAVAKSSWEWKTLTPFLIVCSVSEFEASVTESIFLTDVLPQSFFKVENSKYHFCFLDKGWNKGLRNLYNKQYLLNFFNVFCLPGKISYWLISYSGCRIIK